MPRGFSVTQIFLPLQRERPSLTQREKMAKDEKPKNKKREERILRSTGRVRGGGEKKLTRRRRATRVLAYAQRYIYAHSMCVCVPPARQRQSKQKAMARDTA